MRKLLESAGPYAASVASLALALASLVVLPASLLEGRGADGRAPVSAPQSDVRSVVPALRASQPRADRPQARRKARSRPAPAVRAPARLAGARLATLVRSSRRTVAGRSPGQSSRGISPTRPRRAAPPARRPSPGTGPGTESPVTTPVTPPVTPPAGDPPPSSPPPDAPPASSPPPSLPSPDNSSPQGPPQDAPSQGSPPPEPSVPIVASRGEPEQIEGTAGAGLSPSRSADRSSRHHGGGTALTDRGSAVPESSSATDVEAAGFSVETAAGGGCPPQATSVNPQQSDSPSSQESTQIPVYQHTRSDQAEQRGERHRRG